MTWPWIPASSRRLSDTRMRPWPSGVTRQALEKSMRWNCWAFTLAMDTLRAVLMRSDMSRAVKTCRQGVLKPGRTYKASLSAPSRQSEGMVKRRLPSNEWA